MTLILELTSSSAARPGDAPQHAFDEQGGTIGRASTNSWVLTHNKVSGHHAVISFRNGVFYIEDTSRNGVSVNSIDNRLVRNRPYALKTGDRIVIEPYEIGVWIQGEAAAAPVSRSDPFADSDPFAAPGSGWPLAAGSPDAPIQGDVVDPLLLIPGGASAPRKVAPPPAPADNFLEQHYQPPQVMPTLPPEAPPPVQAIPAGYNPLDDAFSEAPPPVVPRVPTPQSRGYAPPRPAPPTPPIVEPPPMAVAPPVAPSPIPRPPSAAQMAPPSAPTASLESDPFADILTPDSAGATPAGLVAADPLDLDALTGPPPPVAVPPAAAPPVAALPVAPPPVAALPVATPPVAPPPVATPPVEPPPASIRPRPGVDAPTRRRTPEPTDDSQTLRLPAQPVPDAPPPSVSTGASDEVATPVPPASTPASSVLPESSSSPTPIVAAPPAAPAAAPVVLPPSEPAATPASTAAPAAAAPSAPAIAPGTASDLGALLAGAGLPGSAVTPELSRDIGRILRVVVEGLMDVLQSRQRIKEEFGMQQTMFRPSDNNPLKFSANLDDALHNLFVKRNPAYLGSVEAFGDAFDDLRDHQLAVLAGLRVAFDAMLTQFDPDRLQERFDSQIGKSALPLVPAKMRYWDMFRTMRADLTKDPEVTFDRMFGEEFRRAYEEQFRHLKAQRHARAGRTGSDPAPRS